MSPTETSLLGKESDSLWQLEGVPYRTSFSNLMSPATRRCVAHLNYRAKHRDPGATTRFPGTGWGIVREGVIPITNTLVAMHRKLGSCYKVLHHCVSIQLCGASWISGLLFRAERGKRRKEGRGEEKEKKPAGYRGSWCTAGNPGHLPTRLLPLAITCLVVKWMVSAWIVLETPCRAVWRFSGNIEISFTSKGLRGAHFYFPPLCPLLFDYWVSFSFLQQPSFPPDPAIRSTTSSVQMCAWDSLQVIHNAADGCILLWSGQLMWDLHKEPLLP